LASTSVFENRRLCGGGYGNLLLSHLPISAVRNFDITDGRREELGCLRADIKIAGCTVHIFNVHLGTGFMERRRQALKLLSPKILIDPELQGPRVLLGDFNEWTRGLASLSLSENLLSVPLGEHLNWARTYPGLFPILHLDHIYRDPLIVLERLTLHKSRTALIASDQLPLVGDFRLNIAKGQKGHGLSAAVPIYESTHEQQNPCV